MRDLDDTIILFDWNGTIVLDAERARAALNGVLAPRGLCTLSSDEFGERFKLPMHELFAELGVAHPELVAAEAEWNRGMQHAQPVARPGTTTALAALYGAGASLGIVSAASAEAIASDLAALEIPAVWGTVHGGVADKVAVLRRERGARDRAFYLGDTVYDIRSAVEAGYRPIGVTGGYTSPQRLLEAGAEVILSDLGELAGLLNPTKLTNQ